MRYLQLVPGDQSLLARKFAEDYNFEGAFFQWFYSLPELDAQSLKRH